MKKMDIFQNKPNMFKLFIQGILLYILLIVSAFNPFYWLTKKSAMKIGKVNYCSTGMLERDAQILAIFISLVIYIVIIVIYIFYKFINGVS